MILVWSRRNYDFHKLAADAVLDGISDGVIALDARRRLVSYNQAAADIFVQLRGRRPGESVGDVEELREELLEEDAPSSASGTVSMRAMPDASWTATESSRGMRYCCWI